ncbi:DUF4913 domain-containing protein [Cryobacterium sp. M96]|uniref:DUF4913 domain-containing protein n=1 Tax=Cryobacterium sp. M96 TaxID=2048295 RepID=UPI000CE47597
MFLDWLTRHLATVEVVGTKPTPWCTQWWLHPEVIARFKALWQASMQADASVMDGDAGAVSSWWINHWDRHTAVIFDTGNGPFRNCDPDQGHLHRRKDTTAPIVRTSMPPDDVELYRNCPGRTASQASSRTVNSQSMTRRTSSATQGWRTSIVGMGPGRGHPLLWATHVHVCLDGAQGPQCACTVTSRADISLPTDAHSPRRVTGPARP